MKLYREYRIEVGYSRAAKPIFDELDQTVAKLIREGWIVESTNIDDTLGHIDIIYYREIDIQD